MQPQLGWLDLSGTQASGSSLPEGLSFAGLTSLHLLNSRLGSRGCRALAAALPALLQLRVGSQEVDDKGLKALCTLPKVRRFCGRPRAFAGPRSWRSMPAWRSARCLRT